MLCPRGYPSIFVCTRTAMCCSSLKSYKRPCQLPLRVRQQQCRPTSLLNGQHFRLRHLQVALLMFATYCMHCCVIYSSSKSVRSGSTMPRLGMSTSKMVSSACPKCGVVKRNGKLSCCARGGAWFKNCGDVGDTQFDHTWTEGMQSCSIRFLRG